MMKIRSTNTAEMNDRANVIVQGTKILGDILTEANIRIDGEVLGNVTSASKVVIGQGGKIKGNLKCTDADIEGNIDGMLSVENLLTLRANALVLGEITTARIAIEEGAQFSGNCVMQNAETRLRPYSNTESNTIEENVVY